MPRPPRCRRVCSLPAASVFGPVDGGQSTDAIIMGIDEYEVIRLIDWVGLTQEQCAAQINVARTTVTGIYDSAPTQTGRCPHPWQTSRHRRRPYPSL